MRGEKPGEVLGQIKTKGAKKTQTNQLSENLLHKLWFEPDVVAGSPEPGVDVAADVQYQLSVVVDRIHPVGAPEAKFKYALAFTREIRNHAGIFEKWTVLPG
jgi:hypothetical protein